MCGAKIFKYFTTNTLQLQQYHNIIEVRRFNILERDTVFSITQKCYSNILNSYYDIIEFHILLLLRSFTR